MSVRISSNIANRRPSAAQRAAQSARDKQIFRANNMGKQVQAVRTKTATVFLPRGGGPRGSRRSGGNAAVPPVAGFFAPVAEGTIMKSVKPVFMRTSNDRQRIVHREKIAKLTTPGTGVFTVLGTFPLNPGLPQSFPWLSNEAAGWESYRFNRLRFIWVPTSGTAVAGNVIMAPDYDASDAAPFGETAISSYSDCEEANVWARFACDLEQKFLNGNMREKYVRQASLAANLDIKLYDSGNFFVCSADDAAANSGKLWVEYDIDLINPQVPPGGFQASGTLQGATGLAQASLFGTAGVPTGPIGISAAANVLTLTNLQVGQEFSLFTGYAGTGLGVPTQAASSGCTARTVIGGGVNVATTTCGLCDTYTVTAPNPTITVSCVASTVTGSWAVATVLAPVPAF